VLGEYGVEERVAGGGKGLEVLVPHGGGAVVEGSDFRSGEVGGRGHSYC
jgi:hypothetical protein